MPEISASQIPAHDWFRPKLVALLAQAEQAGYARDVAEAVITDLMNGALAAAVPPSETPDEAWARDPGEAQGAAGEMPQPASAEGDLADTGELLGQNKIPLRWNYY
jgi:hypothetical protein